ncbi:adenosine deaminase [Cupriavidus sp. GA3-3]|nr:adenosine deaminase [Cupriavidus sp. GA3-3]
MEAIVRAIVDAEAGFGIVGRLVPSIDREADPPRRSRWSTGSSPTAATR